MQVELVHATTSDGVGLDGTFVAPQDVAPGDRPVDALLLIHGSAGNFYRSGIQSLATRFRDASYPVASFNTRGHDIIWSAGGKLLGHAYEVVDDCRLDLDASISWLANRGYGRIGILGVSLGAVKVTYYQARTKDTRVAAVMAVSPPRFSYSYYLASEDGDAFHRFYQQAKDLAGC
jgi:predicted alpha/beta-fold hydrolase